MKHIIIDIDQPADFFIEIQKKGLTAYEDRSGCALHTLHAVEHRSGYAVVYRCTADAELVREFRRQYAPIAASMDY